MARVAPARLDVRSERLARMFEGAEDDGAIDLKLAYRAKACFEQRLIGALADELPRGTVLTALQAAIATARVETAKAIRGGEI